MEDILEDIRIQIGLLITGFGIGASVLGVELYVFVGNMIMNALNNALPVSEASQSVMSSYGSAIFILTIAGFLQGVLLGLLDRAIFSVGYVLGILFMVYYLGNALWGIAPSIVTGMIFSLIAVLAGLFLKLFLLSRQNDNYRDYNW
ncbi:hypothetical protein RE474_00880 [Methanolobus sediminis]|uniref:Uncharacterized protein n=1 Tax=Methanolobus sediminis TaxID=3072978 RepID=A0AA51YLT2_9EURY|nr:hypothetical protein [Methanolobus sediminis]WMW25304.1 hypothetical protein RE474_00880 [Methanolobus sediminis]